MATGGMHKPGAGKARLDAIQQARGSRFQRTRPTAEVSPKLGDRLQAAMRRPDAPAVARASRAAPPPPLSVLALNRLAFGPRPGDVAAFEALGPDDDARLTAYVDLQLDPASIDDSAADARIAASGYSTLGKPLTQLWADHVVPDDLDWRDRIRPAVETTLATFLRATYSERQLFEVLVGFWHDHFSVFGWEFYEAPTWVHYDRDVIRANALGNFRTLLEAVAKSTPMLIYLDNYLSSEDGPNENYARELMELHTLGDENYYGAVPRNQVPVDGNGVQEGFVDEDVFAVTRALTGWSLSADPWWDLESGDGTYLYRHDWHETTSKNVLGVILPADQGPEQDGQAVLDILASHAGTAQFVCRKLCRRLIGDFPPQSAVDAAAAVFTSNVGAPDQLAQVVRAIVLSPEFRTGWGQKVKRPFETVVSALRAGGADMPFIEDDDETDTFDWLYYNTGHYPFYWHPPNGYPDFAEAWVSSSPRVGTWRLTNWLVEMDYSSETYLLLDAVAQTPAGVRSPNALADFWIDRILGRAMDPADRQEIVDFMAQGRNPAFDLPLDTDDEVQERLQSMVGLLFMCPDFQYR